MTLTDQAQYFVNLRRAHFYYSYQKVIVSYCGIGIDLGKEVISDVREQVQLAQLQNPVRWRDRGINTTGHKGINLCDIDIDSPPVSYEDMSAFTTEEYIPEKILLVKENYIVPLKGYEIWQGYTLQEDGTHYWAWYAPGLTTLLAGEIILAGLGCLVERSIAPHFLLPAYEYAEKNGWERPTSSYPKKDGTFTKVNFTPLYQIPNHPCALTENVPGKPHIYKHPTDDEFFKPV